MAAKALVPGSKRNLGHRLLTESSSLRRYSTYYHKSAFWEIYIKCFESQNIILLYMPRTDFSARLTLGPISLSLVHANKESALSFKVI